PSSGNSPTWVTINSTTSERYIQIEVEDNVGYSGNVYLDSVSLASGSYLQSVKSTSGSVSNSEYLLGPPDGQLAEIAAPNYGDISYIIGNLGTLYSGNLMLDAYSYNNGAGSYTSTVTVYTSPDDSTWTQVYSSTWSPSSNNEPTWFNLGNVNNVQYIKIQVQDNNYYSGNIYIDAAYLS
ncbi:MAG: hypothetical protein ACRDF4_00615, partial [Rhabdochlamydiaceae bacterium]